MRRDEAKKPTGKSNRKVDYTYFTVGSLGSRRLIITTHTSFPSKHGPSIHRWMENGLTSDNLTSLWEITGTGRQLREALRALGYDMGIP